MTPTHEQNVRDYEEFKAQLRDGKAQSNGHRKGDGGTSTNQTGTQEQARAAWPVLRPQALMGLPGDIVRAIEPLTEADSVALLVNTLIAFGNACGSAAHAVVEDSKHATNLFAVEVGETSKGRKGTAWRRIKKLFWQVDEVWATTRIMGGLASGEGLLYNVRDSTGGRGSGAEGPEPAGGDAGEQDKRLLVVEEEFAGTLKVMAREGSTLSTMLRQAWDSGELRTMTKTAPLKATGAHVSVIGHVTRPEVRRYLNETEMANGFANRFLWVCVERSKELPFGGGPVPYGDIIRRLHDALVFAAGYPREIARTQEANALWSDVYGPLSDGKAGMVGAITNRAEAQVLRLGVLYALMECSEHVEVEHLQAALALWQYCDDSASYIFGDATGDPIADRILAALVDAGTAGMTSTEISNLLGRNEKSGRIAAALTDMERAGLIRREVGASTEQGGRKPTLWHALGKRP